MNHNSDVCSLRVLIVAEHASLRFGGEAALPLHYFRVFRRRKMAAWLLVHERTRDELAELFPNDLDRIFFISDTAFHRFLWRFESVLPTRLHSVTFGFILRYLTQLSQRREIRRIIQEHRISLIHQPIPVSPKEPSMIFGMSVPVIIGPMNGGMDYPPGFRKLQSVWDRAALAVVRRLANLMNYLIPGKREAAALLVANERTKAALPRGASARVFTVVENGVDLNLWKTAPYTSSRALPGFTRFVFVGRLVDWKAVDLLLIAFQRACREAPMSLSIIGDGDERETLIELSRSLNITGDGEPRAGTVAFRGWMSQTQCAELVRQCDALVLPSLAECGGAVVLEAMAMEVAVIATSWGGPADYLDASCGILVEPTSRESFVDNLTAALLRLANEPQERIAMGKSGRRKVLTHFDWEAKADRMLEIYNEVSE
jgi:glycosyltransferase involved in cell wall biosynthesis